MAPRVNLGGEARGYATHESIYPDNGLRGRAAARAVTKPRAGLCANPLNETRQQSPLRAAWKTRAPARHRPWALPASCNRAARPERYAARRWSVLMPERDKRSILPPARGGPDRPIGCSRG